MISIIDRYILREVIKSFLAILSVLLLVFISNGFVKILQRAVSGVISNEVLFDLISLESVLVLGTVTPPAFFFAVLYAIGRMYRDSEMTALAACGFGSSRINRSVLLATVPVGLIVAGLTMGGMPWAQQVKEQIYERQKHEAEMGSAVAGRFNEFKKGNLVFFAEEMSEDKVKLRNVFVQNRQHGKLGLITAAEGYQYIDEDTGDRFVVLENAHRYVGEPGRNDFSIGHITEMGVRVAEQSSGDISLPRKARATSLLWSSDKMGDKKELQYRLMLPLAVVVFSIAGVFLSRSLPREGVSGRIVMALLFYFTFLNLQALSGTWMENGVTPQWLGRWWVHIAMLGVVWLFYYVKSPRFGVVSKLVAQRLHR